MNPLISPSLNAKPSAQSYHQSASSIGAPSRELGYFAIGPNPVSSSPIGDTSKLHNLYPSKCGNPIPLSGSVAQSSQYPSYENRESSFAGPHLNRLSQHSTNIVSQSPMTPMSTGPSGYHSRNIMVHYPDSRMSSHNLASPQNQNSAPHGLGASFTPSSYPSYVQGDHLIGGINVWQNQGINHVQERSSYGYSIGLNNPSPSEPVKNILMSDLRNNQSFGQNSNEFINLHQQQPSTHQRSFYSSNQNPEASSLTSHIPSECSSLSYTTHQGPPYTTVHELDNSVNLNQNRGSNRFSHNDALIQTQFPLSYSGPNVNLHSTHPQPSTPPHHLSPSNSSHPVNNNSSNIRYSHQQYSTYSSGQIYEETSASKLSPYDLPNNKLQSGSHSSNFRPTQTTTTSPMPPQPFPGAPERISTSNLPSQPGYLSPRSAQIKSPSSSILSPNSSSTFSHPSPSQLTSSSNSLHHLEQMALSHLSPLNSNKLTSASSIVSSTQNSFYTSASNNNLHSSSQVSSSQQPFYSHYLSSAPSSSSSLSNQSNYYQQHQPYQSNTSNLWQTQSNRSSLSSHLNTHSSLSPTCYSSSDQLPSTQKQQIKSSSISQSNSTVANVTDVSNPQYSLFENESGHSKSIITPDNSGTSILSSCQANISQMESQRETMSSFGIRPSVNKNVAPFNSPQSSQQEELKQQKSQSNSKNSNTENEFNLKLNQTQSHDQSSNLFNVIANSDSNRFPNEQDRTLSKTRSHSIQQTSTTNNKTYLTNQTSTYATNNENNFLSSPISQQEMYQQTYTTQHNASGPSRNENVQTMNQGYANNYSASYDMCINTDQTSTLNSFSQPNSLQFDQNYQNSGMASVVTGHLSTYGNTSVGEMSSMPGFDPYDDTFGSEPPIRAKRKGKGRPKKSVLEPKKEKKPRQPRITKTPRRKGGRCRGARNNASSESHVPIASPLQSQSSIHSLSSDQSHEFGNVESESQVYPISNQSYQTSMEKIPKPSSPSTVPSLLQSSTQTTSLEYSNSLSNTPSLPQEMYSQPQIVHIILNESQDSKKVTSLSTSFEPCESNEFLKENENKKIEKTFFNHLEPESMQPVQINNIQCSNLNLTTPELNEVSIKKNDTNKESLIDSNNLADSCLFDISNQDNNSLPLSSNHNFTNQDYILTSDSGSKAQKNLSSTSLSDALENNKKNLTDLSPKQNFKIVTTQNKRKGTKRKPKEILEILDENTIINEAPPKKIKKKKSKKKQNLDEDKNEINKGDLEISKDKNNDNTNLNSEKTEQSIANKVEETIVNDRDYLNQKESSSPLKLTKVKNKISSKGKKLKVKDSSNLKSKAKLLKLALRLNKKKKKKSLDSSDNSDVEKSPVPSPKAEENGILKRRSARNTKRQKYTDDINLDFSDSESTIDESCKLNEKLEFKLDENQIIITNVTEDKLVVEKIMSSRMTDREIEMDLDENLDNKEKPQMIKVEEYYVKYKSLSYLHCEWKTEEELEKSDKRINQKIKRFKQKKDGNLFDFLDEELFNPDYTEVDRILDVKEIEIDDLKEQTLNNQNAHVVKDSKINKSDLNDKEMENKDLDLKKFETESELEKDDENLKKETKNTLFETNLSIEDETIKKEINKDEEKNDQIEKSINTDVKKIQVENSKKLIRHFLVKWRALPYEESTWELEEDLDPLKIQHFWRYKNPPPKEKWKPKKRPKANEWKKLSISPIYKSENTLREYQLEGVNWLMFCWHNSRNCILADEMGLGKTIQSIAFTQEMVNYGINGPFLIIAPLSTIGNWQREFDAWTDLNVVVYHGSSISRNIFQEYEMLYKKENGEIIENLYKFQVMITTFEIVLTDCLELKKINWRACIIDEAHRLKNRNCKLLEGLRLLDVEHRVLLTGTPLQNNVEELFSLLNFLEPVKFSSSDLFLQEFGDLKTEDQVEKLKSILKPMMLRRLKEDVEKTLAPKEETIIEVELTNAQKKYYRAILERNFQFLTKGNTSSNVPNLMNTMMELRKCCIHPYLINGAEDQILYEYRASKGDGPNIHLDAMVQASGKLVLIDKLLPRLRADGHRVLIFSQMVRCLDILEDYLIQKRYPFERIDGRVRGNLRQAAIDRFCKPDSDRFVFLLCTRAGGLGINLTAADTVIIFDSDWNPQNDLQAQARCHRIGQSKMVKVYRLICRNTYEREMFDKASLKLGLDRAVLQSMNTQKNPGLIDANLSKKEVEDLLRKGAYGAIMDDDNAGDKFCEEDIEQILQRRTHVITIENDQKGSTFSKASFASSDNRTDIEIDDPNFWEKWAKKAHIDVEEMKGKNELIVQEPRKRTQTKRFGQDDSLLELSDVDSSDDDDDSLSIRTRGSRGKVKNKKGKKGKMLGKEDVLEDFAPGNWTRAECFEIEKGLLCFGWGRWNEILSICNFRRNLIRQDVEDVSRAIIAFCLQNCRGEDKKREVAFLWNLIAPSESDVRANRKNDNFEPHFLDKKPKSKKAKKEETNSLHWTQKDFYNPNILFTDEQYRKQLFRSSNKILSRIKMLFYLKQEMIGNLAGQIILGLSYREAHFLPLANDGFPGLPTWWDNEADKSLIMGIYKHGYDRYNHMRLDSNLCFLSRCGPPDNASLLADCQKIEDLNKTLDQDETSLNSTNVTFESKNETEPKVEKKENESNNQTLIFPSSTDLNKRFRALISIHQKNVKLQSKLALQARSLDKLAKFEFALRERELFKPKPALLRKWSRRDESDFYRIISSFGVEYNKTEDAYDWNKFRTLSKLDKKSDFSLTEYFKAFYAMCKRATGRKTTKEEENLLILVDPISEEKANRILARIDLLSKIRVKILKHPDLETRLKLCQHSNDLPDWWEPGKHDKDLLKGAAKYGLNKLDFYLMHDNELSFKNLIRSDESTKKLQENHPKSEMKVTIDMKLFEKQFEQDLNKNKKIKKEDIDKLKKDINVIKKTQNSQSIEKLMNSEENEVKIKVDMKELKEENDKIKIELNNDNPILYETKLKTIEIIEEKQNKIMHNKEEKKIVKENDEADAFSPSKNYNELEKNINLKSKDENSISMQENNFQEDKKVGGSVKKMEKNLFEQNNLESENLNLEKKNVHEKKEKSKVIEDIKEKNSKKKLLLSKFQEHKNVCELNKGIEVTKIEDEQIKVQTESKLETKENSTDLSLNESKSLSDFTFQMLAKGTIRWPKDTVLHLRLEQICYCVEKNEWPSHQQTLSMAAAIAATQQENPDSPSRQASPGVPSQDSNRFFNTDNLMPTESLFSLPDYLYPMDNSGLFNDPSKKRKRRRLQEGEIDLERAKLRDILSQHMDPAKKSASFTNSLINPSFYPPLFSMNFGTLQTNFRKDLSSEDKTPSSLLLSNSLSSSKHSLHRSNLKSSVSSSSSSCYSDLPEGPPPAHQNSSKKTTAIDALNLNFKTSNSLLKSSANPVSTCLPPTNSISKINPVHKSLPDAVNKTSSPSSPTSVLDLSSGLNSRKAVIFPNNQSIASDANNQISLSRKLIKKNKSKIDDLAFTLRQKKMMQEKQNQSKQNGEVLESKLDYEKLKQEQKFSTPPAAHSSSSTKITNSNGLLKHQTQVSNSSSTSFDPNKTLSIKLAKSAILEQTAIIKKWLEKNPKLLAENPTLVAAMLAANAIGVNTSSCVPGNTELFELPDNKKKIRRSKMESNSSLLNFSNLTSEENVPVVNRITGKKITGSKAPSLKHLHDLLAKNPMFDVDPKWPTMFLEKSSNFKIPNATSSASSSGPGSIRTRTSDRKIYENKSHHSNNNNSSKKSTNSLITNSSSSFNSSTSTLVSRANSSSTNPLGLSTSTLNSLGFNSNLIPNLASMKMFMDSSNFAANTEVTNKIQSTSTTNASSLSSNNTTSAVQSMFFPFGGLAAGINPFLGFNIPGFNSNINHLTMLTDLKKGAQDSSSSNNGQEKIKNLEKLNNKQIENSNNNCVSSGNSNSSSIYNSAYVSSRMPFFYPNPNFLYNSFGLGNFPLTSPFASLAAQSGLINNLGNLKAFNNLSSKSSSSSSTSSSPSPAIAISSGVSTTITTVTTSNTALESKSKIFSSSSSSKSIFKNQSEINPSLLLSTFPQASFQNLTSTNLLPTSVPQATNTKTTITGDSDDESLKSLMGTNEDDEDINEGLDSNDLNEKNDSVSEIALLKKSKIKSFHKFQGHTNK